MGEKFFVVHTEFRVRKEHTGEGKNLLGLVCITLDRYMAQPITPGITLVAIDSEPPTFS